MNACRLRKGDALLRISEGKVRGVLSGDEADYAGLSPCRNSLWLRQHISVVIVMASLFMVMQTTIWHRSLGRLSIKKMTKAYADLMEEHGKKPFGNLQTFIRIVSSDVGASGSKYFLFHFRWRLLIVLGKRCVQSIGINRD